MYKQHELDETSNRQQEYEFNNKKQEQIIKIEKRRFNIYIFLVSIFIINGLVLYEIYTLKKSVILKQQQTDNNAFQQENNNTSQVRMQKDKNLVKELNFQIQKNYQQIQRLKIVQQEKNKITQQNTALKTQINKLSNEIRKNSKQFQKLKVSPEILNKITNQNSGLKNDIKRLNAEIESLKKKNNSNSLKQALPQNQSLSYRVNRYRQKGSFKRSFPKTPYSLVFHPPYKLYSRNHTQFITKNNITSVLEIGCTTQCQQKYYSKQKQIQVTYASEDYKQLNNTFQWIVIRQMQISNKIVILAKLAAKNAQKGVTIFLKNIDELRKFNSMYRQFVFQSMDRSGFRYDQTSSLNLRRPQARILLIFNKIFRKSSFPFQKPMKNNIGIQVVLKINQNLPYLRQWIGYHMYHGIDKFFIYDNNGTKGEGSDTIKNRYGFRYQCLNFTDQKIVKQWDSIWEDYYDHIIYAPWQQVVNDSIIYAQAQSMADFIDHFQDVTNYIGFIDVDQMLFSQKNLNFTEFLYWNSLQGNSGISMMQRQFSNRYCHSNQRMININKTYQLIKGRSQAQKCFFQTDQFYPFASIHDARVYKGKKYFLPDNKIWGFNHYNLKKSGILRYQKLGISNNTRVKYDNSGSDRYGAIIDKICSEKCVESFQNICDMSDFGCAEIGIDYYFSKKQDNNNT